MFKIIMILASHRLCAFRMTVPRLGGHASEYAMLFGRNHSIPTFAQILTVL